MNKDLEKFENRSDDWLAKQRKNENKISAWDFDEGAKIKEYHEEHCEAREIKERHEKPHSGHIKPRKKNTKSVFAIIILMMIAVDVIPTIIADKDITTIPLSIIGIAVFMLAITSILKKGNQ